MLLLALSKGVDDKAKGGPIDRTVSRYARESEQYVQKEGLPILFGTIGIGGVVAVYGFLNLFLPKDTAANIVVYTILIGGALLFIFGAICCVFFAIYFLFGGLNAKKK